MDSQAVVELLSSKLISDVSQLINEAKTGLAATVNSSLTLLYWRIGQRIQAEILNGERAEYGEQIVITLAKRLEIEQGVSDRLKCPENDLLICPIYLAYVLLYGDKTKGGSHVKQKGPFHDKTITSTGCICH